MEKEMNWFFEEIFRINFYICIDYDAEQLEKAIMQQFGLEMELSTGARASCVEVIMDDGRYGIFIRVKNQDLDALVHEVTHATNKVFQRVGHHVSSDNDELQAYYNQFLFSKSRSYMTEVLDGGSFKGD